MYVASYYHSFIKLSLSNVLSHTVAIAMYLICITLKHFSPVPPVITLHPSSVVTNGKGNATLSCDATSIVDITFHWEKFNNDDDTWQPLPSSTSLAGMNTMTISSIDIQQSDEGSYRCTASNSAGTSISDVAVITVYGELWADHLL